jgi:hypothetical protein
MKTSLVSPTRIFATPEAHECYDLLCGSRKNPSPEVLKRQRELLGKHLFDDSIQAFYAAAAVGHLLQKGNRYEVKGKTEELIQRQQWERTEKTDLRKAFTYLAKLEYGAKDDRDESLQIVAELAERGIRFIRDKVVDTHDFDFETMMAPLRRITKERGDLE